MRNAHGQNQYHVFGDNNFEIIIRSRRGQWVNWVNCQPQVICLIFSAPEPEPPAVLYPLPTLDVYLGTYFHFPIPEDTFYDPTDGSTSNLELSLLDSTAGSLPPSSWVFLNTNTNGIEGIPLASDDTEDDSHLILSAKNRYGLETHMNITVQLNRLHLLEPSHQFIIRLDETFNTFMAERLNLIQFLNRLSLYFSSQTTQHINVLDIRAGSVMISWTNSSLSSSVCENDTIHSLYNKMLSGDSESASLLSELFPEYNVSDINVEFMNICAYVSTGLTGSQIAIIVVPIVILVVLIIIFILVLWLRCRKQHAGRLLLNDTIMDDKNRKPVVLVDEHELKDIGVGKNPKKPTVLDSDSTSGVDVNRLSLPQGTAKPPPYHSHGGSATVVKDEEHSPPPEYEEYDVPDTDMDENPYHQAPPAYRLPPVYDNEVSIADEEIVWENNIEWISNHIHYKMWDEITDPFPNFNGTTIEVWEWISNVIPHFIMNVITDHCWDWSSSISLKGAPVANDGTASL